jgi:hypothetical protein
MYLECISLAILNGSGGKDAIKSLIENDIKITFLSTQDLDDYDNNIDNVLLKTWILCHASAKFGLGFGGSVWAELVEKVSQDTESPVYNHETLLTALLAWSYNHRRYQLISASPVTMEEEEMIMTVSLLCHVITTTKTTKTTSSFCMDLAKLNLVSVIAIALLSGHTSILETIENVFDFDLSKHLSQPHHSIFFNK